MCPSGMYVRYDMYARCVCMYLCMYVCMLCFQLLRVNVAFCIYVTYIMYVCNVMLVFTISVYVGTNVCYCVYVDYV